MTQRTGAMAGEAVGAPRSEPDGAPDGAGTTVTAEAVDVVIPAPGRTTPPSEAEGDGGAGGTPFSGADITTRWTAVAAWLRPRAAALYPVGDATEPTSGAAGVSLRGRRWLALLGGAALVAVLTAASLVRQTGVPASDSMWAEDGQIFYQQSVQVGFLRSLVRPYNGYLHVVPRILMELVRMFPLTDAAAATAVIGAVATSAMALLVYVASGTHLPSRALRISVAAPIALTWVAQLELGNNLLSLHMYLLYVAFWLCLWNPRSRSALLLGAAVLGLTAASDPLVGLYIPLLVLRAWTLRRDRRRRWIPLAGLGAGLLVQVLAVVFEKALGTRNPPTHYDPVWAAHGYSDSVVGSLFSRTGTGDPYMAGPSGWPVFLGWLALAAAVVCAWRRWSRPDWRLAGLAFAHSVVLFGLLAMKGGSLTPRYVLPALGLLLATMALLLRPERRAERRRVAVAAPAWGLLALVAFAVCHGYSAGTWVRSTGPSWGLAVRQAAAACNVPGAAEGDVQITTGPVHVPCSLVAHRAQFFELGTG